MFKLPYNCTNFTGQQDNAQNPSSQASTVHELNTSRCTSWLDLEIAEKPQIKLPTSIELLKKKKKQRDSIKRKKSTSTSLTMLKPLTVWIITNCGKFLKRGEHQTILLVPEKPVHRKKATVSIGHETIVQNLKRNMSRLHIFSLLV